LTVPDRSSVAAQGQIANRLTLLRERRGVTLAALARTTGVSKSTLSRLETGHREGDRLGAAAIAPIRRAW
jgi:transcriptional regulator with XRE-family HTH domain